MLPAITRIALSIVIEILLSFFIIVSNRRAMPGENVLWQACKEPESPDSVTCKFYRQAHCATLRNMLT